MSHIPDKDLRPGHLRSRDLDFVEDDEREWAEELLGEWVEALSTPAVESKDSIRDRLFETLAQVGRFDLYAEVFSRLIDLDVRQARGILELVDRDDGWFDGPPPARLKWFEGGPATANHMAGFVRVPAGQPFPHHEHLGKESVLILQGRLIDDEGSVAKPGDVQIMAPGTSHSFVADQSGPDLIYAIILEGGVKIGDFILRGPEDLAP